MKNNSGETRAQTIADASDLRNHRQKLFPVLTGSDQSGGSLSLPENIGPELVASNLLVGDSLDSRTPLSIEKNSAADPIRDSLLADSGTLQEPGQASGELGLTSGDIDSATKRSNVRFIHEARSFTNHFVNVNNPVCMTGHKQPCIVVPMVRPVHKKLVKNQKPKKAATRQQYPGLDGKTLGERIDQAMRHHALTLGIEEYSQAMLVRDIEQRLRLGPEDRVQATVSAAMLKSNSCKYLPSMATIMGVDPGWLADGVGAMLPK